MINFKRRDKYVALSNFKIYLLQKSMKNSYKNNKIKMSAPTWIKELELPDILITWYGWYSVSNIQNYFEYVIRKHKTFTDNPPVITYVDKIDNRITFKIKTRYYLERLDINFNNWNNEITWKH